MGYLQGGIAVVLGLFALLRPSTASYTLGVVLAIYLLVAGVIAAMRGQRIKQAGGSSLTLIRGLVGLIPGAIVLFMALFRVGSPEFAYLIISLALIVFGALGLWLSLVRRAGCLIAWGPLIVNGLIMLLGVIILLSRTQNWPVLQITGWILLVGGVLILIWTFLKRDTKEEVASEAV
jgi:uncharacterized membrane protein HdeD (DUF308 family)